MLAPGTALSDLLLLQRRMRSGKALHTPRFLDTCHIENCQHYGVLTCMVKIQCSSASCQLSVVSGQWSVISYQPLPIQSRSPQSLRPCIYALRGLPSCA